MGEGGRWVRTMGKGGGVSISIHSPLAVFVLFWTAF